MLIIASDDSTEDETFEKGEDEVSMVNVTRFRSETPETTLIYRFIGETNVTCYRIAKGNCSNQIDTRARK